MLLSRRCFTLSALALAACRSAPVAAAEPALRDLAADPDPVVPITRTDAEWKALLTAEAYNVLRHQGTERPFSGAYWNNHERGSYLCAGCGLRMFVSEDKFDSGTGWPSFTRPVKADRVKENRDSTLGMVRVEIACARCGGHLGHVFDDGPPPTGLRYCLDSVSLVFRPA